MNYIHWALIGMAGYSAVTLLVKLATRSGEFSGFLVLAIATFIVALAVISLVLLRGDFAKLTASDLISENAWWSYAAGIALTIAVSSLFQALSLGPASTVVPIYGMFIVGGSVLGILFLKEPIHFYKLLGITLAVVSIFLIAKTP